MTPPFAVKAKESITAFKRAGSTRPDRNTDWKF
jgi:hypothetical protein